METRDALPITPASAASAHLEASAIQCEQMAQELDLAVQHLRTAAHHYRSGEIPRSCAHLFAAYGHMSTADRTLVEIATFHAARSRPA